MDGRISSYFSQNQKKQKTANDGKKKQLFDADGWQRPVGLIKSEAIEIGGSDGEDIILVDNQPISQSNAMKHANNDSNSSSRTVDDSMTCPNKHAVKKEEEETIKNKGKDQMNEDAILDLCSPVVKCQSKKDNIPDQDRVKESQRKDTSNDETQSAPVSANPFMQFAHGLGDLESSYFSTLFHERKEEEKPITSKKSAQERATTSKSNSCKPKEKRKRKRQWKK